MTDRRLAAIGLWGAFLTIAVVAASVLLRLGTSLDAGGNASSLLAPRIEAAVRLTHRLAASTVALLAVAAIVAAARSRPVPLARLATVACVALLTAFLSTIGIFTQGYRSPWITVGNVAGGVALACAFWWMHAQSSRSSAGLEQEGAGFALATLAALLVHAATGALASALAMRGDHGLDPLHIALGPIIAALAVAAAARNHRRRPATARAVAALALAQLFIGILLAATAGRMSIVHWSHALLAALLALALVGLAAPRSPHLSPA